MIIYLTGVFVMEIIAIWNIAKKKSCTLADIIESALFFIFSWASVVLVVGEILIDHLRLHGYDYTLWKADNN